jgi:hypothetical protein
LQQLVEQSKCWLIPSAHPLFSCCQHLSKV